MYIVSAIRTLFLMLDSLLVELNGLVFQIFFGLTGLEWTNGNLFNSLASRLYVLIGVFMVFRVTFSLIQMLANPDIMTDKEKGIGKLSTRVLVALVMLVMTPFVFEKAMEFQKVIINSNIIGEIILGVKMDSSTVKKQGELLAISVFKGFVSPNENATVDDTFTACNGTKSDDGTYSGGNIEGTTINYMKNGGDKKINCFTDRDSNDEFYYSYLFGASTIGSVVLAWMVVGYCIDIATRLIKLGFYQILAPIPIITYVNGDKNGPFGKWIKKCLSTYISVFIKLATIYLVIFICSIINNNGINFDSFNGASISTKLLGNVSLILGLLVFAKIVPNLIRDMFGIENDGEEGGLVKQFAKAALFGAAGMAVGAVSRSGAAFRNFNNVRKDPNATLGQKFGAFAGGLGGFAAGALSGGFRNARSGYGAKGWGDAFSGVSQNNARMNEIANRRFNRAAAFRNDHAGEGFWKRTGAHIAGLGVGITDAGSNFIGGGTRAQRQDKAMESLKRIGDLRQSMRSYADNDDTVRSLKKRYEALQNSNASVTDIEAARDAYDAAVKNVVTRDSNISGTVINQYAVEMQSILRTERSGSFAKYFKDRDPAKDSAIQGVVDGVFNDANFSQAFFTSNDQQVFFENSGDYRQSHFQADKKNSK